MVTLQSYAIFLKKCHLCLQIAQAACTFALKTKRNTIMNNENVISSLSAMFPSEISYVTFLEMMNDMELELLDIRMS